MNVQHVKLLMYNILDISPKGGTMVYRIKECREQAGMSQEELAKKSGVSRTIISGLESGSITTTTTKTLMRIASDSGLKVSDIFLNRTYNMLDNLLLYEYQIL